MPNGEAQWKAGLVVFYAGFAVNGAASALTLMLIFYMRKAGQLKLNLYVKHVRQGRLHLPSVRVELFGHVDIRTHFMELVPRLQLPARAAYGGR